MAWAEGTLGAPGRGSCLSVAKHQACAQHLAMRVEGIDLAVAVPLLRVVVGPCSHNGPDALCNYDCEGG